MNTTLKKARTPKKSMSAKTADTSGGNMQLQFAAPKTRAVLPKGAKAVSLDGQRPIELAEGAIVITRERASATHVPVMIISGADANEALVPIGTSYDFAP
ncbi:MAG: hypothetical protein V1487_02230 [bacterium]